MVELVARSRLEDLDPLGRKAPPEDVGPECPSSHGEPGKHCAQYSDPSPRHLPPLPGQV